MPAPLCGLCALACAITIGWSPLGAPTLLSTPSTALRPPLSLTPVPFTAARPGVVSRYVASDARRTEDAGHAGFSPRIVRSVAVRTGREFLAMAVGAAGQLWLTKDGTPAQRPVVGHLVRVTTRGKISLDRPVGGDPVALAASGPYVWVANGTGDGKTPEAEANTVLQIDASPGRIVHRYHLDQPYEVAASGDTAWVAAAGRGAMSRAWCASPASRERSATARRWWV